MTKGYRVQATSIEGQNTCDQITRDILQIQTHIRSDCILCIPSHSHSPHEAGYVWLCMRNDNLLEIMIADSSCPLQERKSLFNLRTDFTYCTKELGIVYLRWQKNEMGTGIIMNKGGIGIQDNTSGLWIWECEWMSTKMQVLYECVLTVHVLYMFHHHQPTAFSILLVIIQF